MIKAWRIGGDGKRSRRHAKCGQHGHGIAFGIQGINTSRGFCPMARRGAMAHPGGDRHLACWGHITIGAADFTQRHIGKTARRIAPRCQQQGSHGRWAHLVQIFRDGIFQA